MEYQKYLIENKELYDYLLQFIDDEDDHQNLFYVLRKKKILENLEEAKLFLQIIAKISNNHHRYKTFISKIKHILQFCFDFIKQNLSNIEIFNIFKSNKLIILFLIEQNVLIIDETIAKAILYRSLKTNTKYHFFFYPEIKKFLNNQQIEKIEEFLEEDKIKFDNFVNYRKNGENENYICDVIRNDLICDFTVYINKTNLSLHSSKIIPSFFETNSFLEKNEPTLIEYAAFYGSIQIFQFMKFKNVDLPPSLWLYAIHSNNAEMIHLLEQYAVELPKETYKSCFYEAIKCHHNNIANYISEQYLLNKVSIDYKNIFQYYNMSFIPNKLENNDIFYYICRYDYSDLIKLYLKPKQKQTQYCNSFENAVNDNKIDIIYLLLMKLPEEQLFEKLKKCNYLKQIALPPNVTEIKSKSFYLFSIVEISIPSSVTSIEDKAFYYCN